MDLDRSRSVARGVGGIFLLSGALAVLSCAPSREEPAEPGNTMSSRSPLPGILLGQPLGGGLVLSGGLSPCAEGAVHALDLVHRFLSLRAPLSPPGALEGARIDERSFTFQVELTEDLDPPAAVDAWPYSDARVWQVVRCDRFNYYNESFGRSVTRRDPYPYGEVDPTHLEYFRPSAPVYRLEPPPDPEGRWTWDSVPHLDPGFVNRLPLARIARPLNAPDELEEVVDFLYQIGRIPLAGFNQRGELVRRDVLIGGDAWIVEDQVRWIVYDDALPPGGQLNPPSEAVLQHVVIYEEASGRLAHYSLPDSESDRDHPHVRVSSPGEGLVLGGRIIRPLILRGTVAHGREILSRERMEWTSDRDGRIAEGLGAIISADQLSPGDHEITFRACDLHMQCAEDSVRIRVEER